MAGLLFWLQLAQSDLGGRTIETLQVIFIPVRQVVDACQSFGSSGELHLIHDLAGIRLMVHSADEAIFLRVAIVDLYSDIELRRGRHGFCNMIPHGCGQARLRHFLLDAGKCIWAFIAHAVTVAYNWNPYCAEPHKNLGLFGQR